MKRNHDQRARWQKRNKEQNRFFWLVGGLFVLFIIIIMLSEFS